MLFKNYKALIESIIQGIRTGTTSATFTDYLQVIGTSLLIMFIIAATIALIIMAVKAPKMFIHKMTYKIKDEISKLALANDGKMSEEDVAKSLELQTKLKKRHWACGCIITFVYLPIVIPTLLIIIDFLLRIF